MERSGISPSATTTIAIATTAVTYRVTSCVLRTLSSAFALQATLQQDYNQQEDATDDILPE
jgi:hypothetical protein